MPLRFFRRVRIAPGVTVNLSKSGPSVSVGPRGAKVTLGHGRVRRTVGLPGTGLFYTTATKLGSKPPAIDANVAPQPMTEPPTTTGFWARRSLGGKVAIVVIGLIAAGLLVSAANRPGTGAPSAVSPALGLVGAVASNSPKPTAKATPRPTPKPTAAVTNLSIRVTSLASPVGRGSSAKVSIDTSAGARCSIEVQYASGPSSASGLGDKTASSSGAISWSWNVGSRTALGTWPIYLDCSKGSAYNVLETRFTVVR